MLDASAKSLSHRGIRFNLSRDELLTLPEFVLLSLFPNGLFPEGHMGGFADGDAVQVDVSTLNDNPISQVTQAFSNMSCSIPPSLTYAPLPRSSTIRSYISNINIHFTDLTSQYDPASLQYMLDFFRNVAQSIPNESSPTSSPDGGVVPIDSLGGRGEDGSKRAGIIVLREDLDFYAIPPRPDINQVDMMEVKRAASRALLKQDGIFSGLKRSDEPGTTEAHLIEMLTAGGFNHDDQWGHRAGEPNKAVVCSLALARLRSDIRGNEMGSNAVGMAQKLLLFWRKPARRCWWEGVELKNVEGVDGPLKVWIRRVWTLEMSVIGLR
ncbi:general stress response protein Whi2 [Xylaria cf. heliscus]|nr:general stress response protein Whi2 [Xylaria cf. heliscus]